MEAIIEYVCGGLLILCILLGSTVYYYHGEVETLSAQNVILTTKLRQSEADVLLAQKSCAATQAITDNVAGKIQVQQTVMTKALENLATTPSVEEVPQDKSNANSKTTYADDATLSPQLMGVLSTAYCGASPSDAACATK